MGNLQALYRLLSEYKEFKRSLEDLLDNLKNALDPLEFSSRNIQETFLYNDYGADNQKIASNRGKINNVIVTIERVILPEVNRKITSINRQIADAEMAQALNASM